MLCKIVKKILEFQLEKKSFKFSLAIVKYTKRASAIRGLGFICFFLLIFDQLLMYWNISLTIFFVRKKKIHLQFSNIKIKKNNWIWNVFFWIIFFSKNSLFKMQIIFRNFSIQIWKKKNQQCSVKLSEEKKNYVAYIFYNHQTILRWFQNHY